MLVQEMEEEQIEEDFVNLLIKMFNLKTMSPLERINFILEYVNKTRLKYFNPNPHDFYIFFTNFKHNLHTFDKRNQ